MKNNGVTWLAALLIRCRVMAKIIGSEIAYVAWYRDRVAQSMVAGNMADEGGGDEGRWAGWRAAGGALARARSSIGGVAWRVAATAAAKQTAWRHVKRRYGAA